MEKTITLDVNKDETTGEYYILIPPDFLPEDWNENSVLEWIDNKDGSWTVRKKCKYVLVECINTFRTRYVIEVPEDAKCDLITYAEDTVSMEKYNLFSQQHLGERIFSSREITKDEVISMCDQENEYAREWDTEKKMEIFVTGHNDTELEKDE